MARVSFRIDELNELIKNPNSGVTLVPKCTRQLVLSFFQLTNLKNYITEYLYSTVAKYDSQLDAVILSYKKIALREDFSVRSDGKSKISYTADIYVFKPKIGSILSGVVNKRSKDHIGCLVHKVFNVAIPKPTLEDTSSWIGSELEIGDNVQFKVIDEELNEVMPYIKAELIDSDRLTYDDENEYTADNGTYQAVKCGKNKMSPKKIQKQHSGEDSFTDNSYTKEQVDECDFSDVKIPFAEQTSVKSSTKKKKRNSNDETMTEESLIKNLKNEWNIADQSTELVTSKVKKRKRLDVSNEQMNSSSETSINFRKQKNVSTNSINELSNSNEEEDIREPKKKKRKKCSESEMHTFLSDEPHNVKNYNRVRNKDIPITEEFEFKEFNMSNNSKRKSKKKRYSMSDVEDVKLDYVHKKKKSKKKDAEELMEDKIEKRKRSFKNENEFHQSSEESTEPYNTSSKDKKIKNKIATNSKDLEFDELNTSEHFKRKSKKKRYSLTELEDIEHDFGKQKSSDFLYSNQQPSEDTEIFELKKRKKKRSSKDGNEFSNNEIYNESTIIESNVSKDVKMKSHKVRHSYPGAENFRHDDSYRLKKKKQKRSIDLNYV